MKSDRLALTIADAAEENDGLLLCVASFPEFVPVVADADNDAVGLELLLIADRMVDPLLPEGLDVLFVGG